MKSQLVCAASQSELKFWVCAWSRDLLKKIKKLFQPVCEGDTVIKEKVEKECLGYRIQIKTEISTSHNPNLEVQQAEYQQMTEQIRVSAIFFGRLLGAHKIYYVQFRL